MASDGMDALDDDQWLYGDGTDADEESLNKVTFDPEGKLDSLLDQIDDVDELDDPSDSKLSVKSNGGQKHDETVNDSEHISDTLQVKQEEEDSSQQENEATDSEDDDDDNINITIGDINPTYGRAGYGRLPSMSGTAGESLTANKKIDLDGVPQLNGVPLPDIDLDSIDKPWQKPGADITDYFNYGFTEDTWKLYCDKQRKMRYEAMQLSKLVTPKNYAELKKIFTFEKSVLMRQRDEKEKVPTSAGINVPLLEAKPTLDIGLMPPSLATAAIPNFQIKDLNAEIGDDKTTPPPDSANTTTNPLLPAGPALLNKHPILPPPGLPPPHLPMLPQTSQDVAAVMAMFAGAPPPPIRPDFPPGFPPPIPGGVPPFPPPGMPPPFGFPGDHTRGPPPMDDRGPLLPHEAMGFPPGFSWDPSMGPPPPDIMESFRRSSRSPSRSSSSGRSSEREDSRSRHRKDRQKDRSRDHRHHGRSRSRSRDRHRHRDYRDRGRSDRHEKEKREHRRREERRHEKSSRRHRSTSADDTTHRSHKKRASKSSSPS